MCKKRFKAFDKLSLDDKMIITNKFKDGDKGRQKIIRIPAINSVWLLVPEGSVQRQIGKAQSMIENFSKGCGNLDLIISTEVPRKFLEAS